jgi:hypothetical protein
MYLVPVIENVICTTGCQCFSQRLVERPGVLMQLRRFIALPRPISPNHCADRICLTRRDKLTTRDQTPSICIIHHELLGGVAYLTRLCDR